MHIRKLLLCTLTLLATLGCNQPNGFDRVMNQADSIMEADQDNAKKSLMILDKMKPQLSEISKAQRMRYNLLYAKAMNKGYISFTSDSTMKEVTAYYDSHGSNYEKMTAHYLLGCAYRDLGDAPQALACLNDALDYFHPSGNSDYSMVSRIYAQKGDLFKQQQIHNKAVADFRKASHYAFLAKDTLSAINYYLQQTTYYAQMGKANSAAYISLHAYELYNKYGYPQFAPRTLAYAVSKYISDGNLKKGKKYLDIYLSDSTLYASDGMLKDDAVFSLYYLGEYYQKANRQDSAMYFYHELLHRSRNINDRKGAYEGLSEIFNVRHQYDSAYIYSRRLVYAEDSSYHQSVCDHIQQIESAYNYQRSSDLANRQTERLNHVIIIVILLSFTVVLLMLISYYIYTRRKRIMQQRIALIQERYETEKTLLQQEMQELYALLEERQTLLDDKDDLLQHKQEELNSEIDKREESIAQLQKRVLDYEREMNMKDLAEQEDKIQNTPLKAHFQLYLKNVTTHPSAKEWGQLSKFAKIELPKLYMMLNNYSVTEYEFRICILTRLKFKPKEVSVIVDCSFSEVTLTRTRLLKKIYGIEGKSGDFDKRIMLMY